MLVFAYDGSLNGDWVAHYAARFAANTRERTLRLVHVQEASPPSRSSQMEDRIARIAAECRLLGVVLEAELHARGNADVAERLLELVPAGAMVVAGTRARPRKRALLANTVSARLIAAGRFSVVAIRVLHPGVLGQPGRVLLPLTEQSRGAETALPLLRLIGADLVKLHVLFVRELSRLCLRLSGHDRVERLVESGHAFVARVEEELRAGLAPHRFELDSSVLVSDDAPREMIVHAGKLRSRLICLGVPERTRDGPLAHGSTIERVLRDAPADVAVYRSVD